MTDVDFAPVLTDARGCGKRKDQGLYACTGLAEDGQLGMPIESFIIDPPIRWENGPFRGVRFLPRDDGAVDIMLWVGAENYPFLPDYVEEARQMGFCKRIPTGAIKEDGSIAAGNNDYSKVVPHVSNMVLVHPRAVIESNYTLQVNEGGVEGMVPHVVRHSGPCGGGVHHYAREWVDGSRPTDPCTFATWDLSAMQGVKGHNVDQCVESHATISTPSVEYRVVTPLSTDGAHFHAGSKEYVNLPVRYSPGIFALVPLGHFEYVNQSGDGTMPTAVAELLGDNINNTAVKEQ